ncbi:hypothetical protein LXL04_004680 [Taraxacum kok-saghyz]
MDLSTICIGILVNSVSRIEEFIEVLWREEKYNVWIPNFVYEGVGPKPEDELEKLYALHEDVEENPNVEKTLEEGEFFPNMVDCDEEEEAIYVDHSPTKMAYDPSSPITQPIDTHAGENRSSPVIFGKAQSPPFETRCNDAFIFTSSTIPNVDT